MHITRLTILFSVLAIALPIAASAENKCDGAVIANGPFQYALVSGQVTAHTFVGTGGLPATSAFTVTAPGPGTVFPAESPGAVCSGAAPADLKVFGIEKVVDGVNVPLNSTLGAQIAGAFTLTPPSHVFGIGDVLMVGVTVINPNVGDQDYGSYVVTIKSQAVGSGIGVGSGFQFTLNLQPATACVDTDAPVISILKPTSVAKILGNIKVKVQAYDPTGACASGLKSLTATVSSAGGAVSNLSIPLTLNNALPVAAGTTVTGDGVFTPKGGSGTAGTLAGLPFTASNLSGIGTYTITVTAEDVAGNTQHATVTFDVNYAAVFTKAQTPGGCKVSNLNPCEGQYQFTVKRADNTDQDDSSDGATMYDQTVAADLVRSGDSTVAGTHTYGTGAITAVVKIDFAVHVYETNFDHPADAAFSPYVLKVYFTDVDGNRLLQATSTVLSF